MPACAMKLKSKRSISFPEDGQMPPAWLTLTVTLMICYCHNSRFRAAPRPRLVVILRRKLRRGLLRELLRSGEASFFSSAGSILLTSVVPMQRRKIGVIVRAATTLALLASGASADAADVAICSLVAKPSNFDRQAVTFQGIATAVKKNYLAPGQRLHAIQTARPW